MWCTRRVPPSTLEYPGVYPRVPCSSPGVGRCAGGRGAADGRMGRGGGRRELGRFAAHASFTRAVGRPLTAQGHAHARTHAQICTHRDTPARAHTLTLARTRPHTCARTYTRRQPDAIGRARIETGPKRSLGDGSAVGLRMQQVGSRAARRGVCAIDRATPLPMHQAHTAAPTITTATMRRRCGGCSPSGTRARCAGGRKSPQPLHPQYSRTLNPCPYSSVFLEPRPPRNPGIPQQ